LVKRVLVTELLLAHLRSDVTVLRDVLDGALARVRAAAI
jgi:hypothetical protein